MEWGFRGDCVEIKGDDGLAKEMCRGNCHSHHPPPRRKKNKKKKKKNALVES